MAKAKSLRDAIVQDASRHKPGFPAWHERLPPEVLIEVEAVRDDWRAGVIATPMRTLARSISDNLRARNLPTAGPDEVSKWLVRKA